MTPQLQANMTQQPHQGVADTVICQEGPLLPHTIVILINKIAKVQIFIMMGYPMKTMPMKYNMKMMVNSMMKMKWKKKQPKIKKFQINIIKNKRNYKKSLYRRKSRTKKPVNQRNWHRLDRSMTSSVRNSKLWTMIQQTNTRMRILSSIKCKMAKMISMISQISYLQQPRNRQEISERSYRTYRSKMLQNQKDKKQTF